MDVIDYLVDNGNTNILEAISAKDFLICILTILKTKHSQSIQCTILGLIKKWGETFSNTPNTHLSNFVEMYHNLKNNNVTFPNNYVSMYKNYINKPIPSQTTTNVNIASIKVRRAKQKSLAIFPILCYTNHRKAVLI